MVEAAVDDVGITGVLGNQPPQVTNPGDQTGVEGTVVNLQISATDADGDSLTYSDTNLPTGLSINSSTGLISGTVTASPQVFAVEITVDDSTDTSSVNFNWTINPDNDPPVVTNPGSQTNQEGDSSITLQINASDADGDTLTYNATDLPPGLSINSSTGLISGDLDFNSSGTYSVEITVTDEFFVPSVGFIWIVTDVNRAPSFDGLIGNQTNVEGDSVNLSASASDPDNDTLTYSATGLPDGVSVNSSTGSITGTLSAISSGNYNVQVTVSDGSLTDVQNFDWTVTNVNQPPSVTNPGNQTNQQTDIINLQISASDAEGDPLTYSSAGLPANLNIDLGSGLISGALNDSVGTYPITVTVSDGTDPVVINLDWIVTELSVCTVELDFESNDGGWTNDASSTCSTGTFITGTPTEVINSGVTTQLAGDHTSGSAQALFTAVNTGAGTDDVDSGECSVQSPNYSVSQASDLSIWYFHGQRDAGDDASGDYFRLEYTLDNGSNWVELASNGDQTSNAVWAESTANIAAGSTVRLRAVVSDGAGPGDLIEAGLDDLAICSTGGVNTPPSVTNPGDQTNQQADNVNLQIQASDAQADVLSFSSTTLPSGLNVNSSTGEITGAISAVLGDYNVTIDVSDGQSTSNVSFVWTVADETGQQVIYVSSTTGGNVGGVSFADEDILSFNTATQIWQIYLDGSDIGLNGSGNRDINAFTLLGDGSLVFSIISATTVPDVGDVDDSDLIRFIPTSTGANTSGTFELYFDGSDVEFTSNGEDIDGISILANGDLLISTIGGHSAGGISGSDEDLIVFTPLTLGTATSGTWSAYFDGSDVDLGGVTSEDVYGVWLDENNGDIYLTTAGAFSANGLTGDGADIFICSPISLGSTTSCNYSLYWAGSAAGFAGENLDGIYIE